MACAGRFQLLFALFLMHGCAHRPRSSLIQGAQEVALARSTKETPKDSTGTHAPGLQLQKLVQNLSSHMAKRVKNKGAEALESSAMSALVEERSLVHNQNQTQAHQMSEKDSVTGALGAPYGKFTTKTCELHGMQRITDFWTCEAAAKVYDRNEYIPPSRSDGRLPTGCVSTCGKGDHTCKVFLNTDENTHVCTGDAKCICQTWAAARKAWAKKTFGSFPTPPVKGDTKAESTRRQTRQRQRDNRDVPLALEVFHRNPQPWRGDRGGYQTNPRGAEHNAWMDAAYGAAMLQYDSYTDPRVSGKYGQPTGWEHNAWGALCAEWLEKSYYNKTSEKFEKTKRWNTLGKWLRDNKGFVLTVAKYAKHEDMDLLIEAINKHSPLMLDDDRGRPAGRPSYVDAAGVWLYVVSQSWGSQRVTYLDNPALAQETAAEKNSEPIAKRAKTDCKTDLGEVYCEPLPATLVPTAAVLCQDFCSEMETFDVGTGKAKACWKSRRDCASYYSEEEAMDFLANCWDSDDGADGKHCKAAAKEAEAEDGDQKLAANPPKQG